MAGYLLSTPRSLCQRLVQARLGSFKYQYQVSVSDGPWAVFRPSALMSVANTNKPSRLCPPLARPNSDACLIELMVSPPALASPTTLALEACACSRNDEKSLVLSGWRTLPSTLPPFFSTTAAVSRSSAYPNA